MRERLVLEPQLHSKTPRGTYTQKPLNRYNAEFLPDARASHGRMCRLAGKPFRYEQSKKCIAVPVFLEKRS